MAHQSRQSDACAEINAAQTAVQNATRKYERGGGVDEMNKSNKRLAEAHQALYRVNTGLVSDDR
jgi:hypothetical protein